MGKRRKRKKRKPKKQKRRERLTGFLITAMLLLAIYFALFGGEYTLLQLRKMEDLRQQRADEVARIETEIDSLRAQAERLRNDPDAIERVARERYGMIRDGEILYRFREAEDEREGN